MATFEASGKRNYLEKLQQILTTIPTTGVEAERAFSACGRFVTKVRSRSDGKCINSMCFLRSYFKYVKV